MPEMPACAAQYNAPRFEIRHLGSRIINSTKDVDGIRHLWFKPETGHVPTVPQALPLFAGGRDAAQ